MGATTWLTGSSKSVCARAPSQMWIKIFARARRFSSKCERGQSKRKEKKKNAAAPMKYVTFVIGLHSSLFVRGRCEFSCFYERSIYLSRLQRIEVINSKAILFLHRTRDTFITRECKC